MTYIHSLDIHSLVPTNSCLVVCDLDALVAPDAPAWSLLQGSQAEIGAALAAHVSAKGVSRLDDYGGVAKSILSAGDAYLDAPPRVRDHAAVYSFTPKNKIAAEGLAMALCARKAGYRLLVLTVQKEGKYGKVWGLRALLSQPAGPRLVYYEDTASVVDELKAAPEGDHIEAVHVLAPGWEDQSSARADRVLTQAQYQAEVLLQG